MLPNQQEDTSSVVKALLDLGAIFQVILRPHSQLTMELLRGIFFLPFYMLCKVPQKFLATNRH